MADPATNTSYPGAIDPLPEIGPNTKQNDPQVEHDVMHDKVHAIANALMALVGTLEDDHTADTLLGRLLHLSQGLDSKLNDAPEDGVAYGRKDGAWDPIAEGAGDKVTVIQVAATARTLGIADAGVHSYVRCTSASGTALTFDSSEGYSDGLVFNIRAAGVGSVELVQDGVVLTPPKGGTLILEPGDTVTVIMSSPTAGDVMGSTELAL